MTTHRSLNKLEFKAHMSIHDMKEVSGSEGHGSRWTRDRFGKNHLISEADGSSRPRRRKKTAIGSLVIAGLLTSATSLVAEIPELGRPHTNIQVESEDYNERVLHKKLHPLEEDYGLYINENTSVEIADDAYPYLERHF